MQVRNKKTLNYMYMYMYIHVISARVKRVRRIIPIQLIITLGMTKPGRSKLRQASRVAYPSLPLLPLQLQLFFSPGFFSTHRASVCRICEWGLHMDVSKTRRSQSQMPRRTLGSPASSNPSSFKGPSSTQSCEFLFFLFSPPCHCESLSLSSQIYFFLHFTTDHPLSIPNNTYVLLSNSFLLKPPLSHEIEQNGVCTCFVFLISQTFAAKRQVLFHRQYRNHHRRQHPPDFSSFVVMKSIGAVCGD